jgi:HAD superfamily hydrolase (TIGR01509 family)
MKYKTYLFDLDGVLINSDEIQHLTIIQAINDVIQYNITIHPNYNLILLPLLKSTITTLEKLENLTQYITLDENTIVQIYKKKKELADLYFNKLSVDQIKIELFQYLKRNNCKTAVVTNSNKNSTNIILQNIGIYDYVDVIVTNEDVGNKKPNPEPYLRAIERLKSEIDDCIIFEDSEIGILSAKNTGCKYHIVNNYMDVNLSLILEINL